MAKNMTYMYQRGCSRESRPRGWAQAPMPRKRIETGILGVSQDGVGCIVAGQCEEGNWPLLWMLRSSSKDRLMLTC